MKLKGQVTTQDVEKLKAISAQTAKLTVGLHPSAPSCQALMTLLWAMRACIREWQGDEIDSPVFDSGSV